MQVSKADVEGRVLDTLRSLLAELGSTGALGSVSARAHLDSDLGLGSLERVELLARLETAFGVQLPDSAVAEADSAEELAEALMRCSNPSTGTFLTGEGEAASGTNTARIATAQQGFSERGVEAAQTLMDVLRYRACHDAARTHLHITQDEGGNATLTFGELAAGAQQVAAELARRGVAAGDTVALMLPTSSDFFLTFAGILMAGAIPVPIYPPVRVDRIEEYATRQSAILQNAEAKLLVTFRRAQAVAHLLKPRVVSLAGVIDAAQLIAASVILQPPGVLPANIAANRTRKPTDIALLQYTSGSTGEPKGVVLTHANLLANIRAIGEAMQVRSSDVGVSWLPLYHDMGLIGAWLMPLYFGLPLAVLSPLAFLTHPQRWLWAVHQHRGTLAAAPNFAYELCTRRISDGDIEGLDLSSWRAALNGAEPVNPQTLERFCKRFAKYGFRPESMLPVYGLAEAALIVTAPPLNRGAVVDRIVRSTFASEGRAVPVGTIHVAPEATASSRKDASVADGSVISFVSCGAPVPKHEVRIVDEHGQEVGDRMEGYLWFRGPSATRGYYRNEVATETLFPQGRRADGQGHRIASDDPAWVSSGDRAYRAEGEIYITGREKDIIIKAGRNLYPHEVEEMVGRIEGVRKGCVVAFGLKDAAAGTERVVIVAESRETTATRRTEISRAITDEVNSSWGLPPDAVEIVRPGSIPKTSSGKLRREETKRLYEHKILGGPKRPVWMQIARVGCASALRGSGQAAWRVAKRVVELAYGVYATALFAVSLVLAWAMVILMPTRRAACRITAGTLKVLFALAGCRIRVRGREFLDGTRAKVLVANHASYCDVLVLMAGLGVNYRFVAKREVRSMPFIGTFLRTMGHHAFDRSDPKARVRQAEQIEQTLMRGESVFVFPEGTFTPYQGVQAFQLGAFKAAVAAGCPVCPIALRGTREILRDETYLPRPGSVTITVCPPIEPGPVAAGPTESDRHQKPSGWSGETSSDWHEIVRLRDAAREAIGRECGEPML